nr:PREDICTED: complement decay-accelerating factor-like isoform X1 [Anolis carolinensis]|eukprot:XP_016850966.1 PREDICTED: complement decay-accelerating factor-like isoform X1 [Anolis carolinensis]
MGRPLLPRRNLTLLGLFSLLSGIGGDCGPPPKLNNAVPNEKLLGESFPHMKSVTYKCLDGFYNIYGKLDVVTCLSDSQWTPIEEFCERSCVDPPRSRFARINPKDIKTYYPAESKVSFTCRPGYNTIPEVGSTVTCFTNYTWTALPVFCEGKPCGDPGKPENGDTVILTNLLYLAKVNFICEEGYKLKGSSSAQCLLQGDGVKWKPDPPKCQQITCFSPPNVAKASINGSSTGNFVYNSTVTYQCDDGFSLIGEASLRCTTEDNVNGVWRGSLPECKGDCPAPRRQPDATLRGGPEKSNYPVGTVLRYDCIPGYQFKPGTRPTIRCQANSKWSSESSLCERKPCKPPTIDNGKFEGDIRLGDEITFSCDFGFRLLGQATSRCILTASGSVDWSRSPPYCDKIACNRPPSISNGDHNGDTSLDNYLYGVVVTYTCFKDFSLIGHPSITCTVAADGKNGKWSRPPPECKVVNCPRPSIPDGRLTSPFQPTYKYDHVLQFVCNAGAHSGRKSVCQMWCEHRIAS